MIRINLLPAQEKKRPRGPRGATNTFGIIAFALILLELVALYFWYSSVDEAAAKARGQARRAKSKVTQLKQAKAELDKRAEDKKALAKQSIVFDQLRAQKTGPAEMLQFMAYVLTPKEDNLYNRDEINAQEAAGWAPNWDPRNVWLTHVEQSDLVVAFEGLARAHEDVSEFYKRLESGPYLLCLDPDVQEVVHGQPFSELELVSFKAEAHFNPSMDLELKLAHADIPRCIRDQIPAKKAEQPGAQKAPGGKQPPKKGGKG